MKYRIASTLMIVLLLGATPRALAQDDGSAADNSPTALCGQAQNYLSSTQKPQDLQTRENLLQAYQYIYQRMNIFVSRLEYNHQPEAVQLRTSLNSLNTSISSFKSDYDTYDSARDAVTSVKDCSKNFTSFSAALTNARNEREAVTDDVEAIQTNLTNNIEPQLGTLYQQLQVAPTSKASS